MLETIRANSALAADLSRGWAPRTAGAEVETACCCLMITEVQRRRMVRVARAPVESVMPRLRAIVPHPPIGVRLIVGVVDRFQLGRTDKFAMPTRHASVP
jgi:hypothetical protein